MVFLVVMGLQVRTRALVVGMWVEPMPVWVPVLMAGLWDGRRRRMKGVWSEKHEEPRHDRVDRKTWQDDCEHEFGSDNCAG